MNNRIHEQLNLIGINPMCPLGKMITEILTVLAQFERERRLNRVA